MKKLFISIVAVGMAMTASAQQTDKQMATLQHGDKTTVYYGIDAFVSAYNAAADTLDVITLSSGEFNVPSTISKSLAIYGTGFERDTITGTERTYLREGLTLTHADIKDDDGLTVKAGRHVNGIHLEGLFINGGVSLVNNNNIPIFNVEIAKCRISTLALGVVYNCSFRQCFINTLTPIGKDNYCNDILVTNCYINYLKSNNGIESMWFSTESTIAINNSILKSLAYKNSEGLFPFYFSNNISYVNLPSTANLINNVFVGSGTPIQDVNGNWTGVPNAALWAAEGEDGSYSEKKDFALKYPERYVGNDGTEIGLHGGVYAWNKIPCIPRITECTIDTENASNGTIKVSIKAEAQTKE